TAIQGVALLNEKWFQTPCGDVKVTAITPVSDTQIQLTMQKGTGPTRNVLAGIDELSTYSFAPSTQLFVIPGAIRRQFPTYIQDPAAGRYLTQVQMDAIVAYVLTLQPWV
ncbi:MAG: hypothetical protein ACREMO_00985, partial [Gemmatimonadales bacterium]